MPTYEYRCTECTHEFEAFQMMRDAPLEACPKCHGKVKRLIGRGAGIIFKGSGFYETDYRSDSYRKAAEKEGKTAATAESSKASANGPAKESAGKDTTSKPTSSSKPI